jgi:hypothetical protein
VGDLMWCLRQLKTFRSLVVGLPKTKIMAVPIITEHIIIVRSIGLMMS